MSEIRCSLCNGKRESIALVRIQGIGCQQRTVPCSLCEGTGVISAEVEAWVAEGRRIRNYRVAHNRSLREEATRQGLDPIALNEMEHGREKPYTQETQR
jgi:DnaJ-class molecular chaperone